LQFVQERQTSGFTPVRRMDFLQRREAYGFPAKACGVWISFKVTTSPSDASKKHLTGLGVFDASVLSFGGIPMQSYTIRMHPDAFFRPLQVVLRRHATCNGRKTNYNRKFSWGPLFMGCSQLLVNAVQSTERAEKLDLCTIYL